jgi:uncharacterized protein DUF6966
MRVWRWLLSGDQPERDPNSDKQRMEQLLYRLADLIGDSNESDRFWSAKVRACADPVRAGKPWGLRNFLNLFGGMGSINDQGFSHPLRKDLSEAYALANKLEIEETSGHRERDEIVRRPWREGHTGKAVVYRDGMVVATEADAHGQPSIQQIRLDLGEGASERHPPVAVIGIQPDGSCDAYRCDCDEHWLAARLHDHHPRLHLGQKPPRV